MVATPLSNIVSCIVLQHDKHEYSQGLKGSKRDTGDAGRRLHPVRNIRQRSKLSLNSISSTVIILLNPGLSLRIPSSRSILKPVFRHGVIDEVRERANNSEGDYEGGGQ